MPPSPPGAWGQVYLKLVAGDYAPVRNAVNLRAFGEELAAGCPVRGDYLARRPSASARTPSPGRRAHTPHPRSGFPHQTMDVDSTVFYVSLFMYLPKQVCLDGWMDG